MLKDNRLDRENPRYEKSKAEGKIDELCIPFCDLLNRIGLKTDYCCQGHPFDLERSGNNELFNIIFDNNLPDAEIFAFMMLLEEVGKTTTHPRLRYSNGTFYKRHNIEHGIISSTWVYMIIVADERMKESIIWTEKERFQVAEQLYLKKREELKDDMFSPWR